MTYQVNFTRTAIRALEKIPEPYYSAIKQAIIALAESKGSHAFATRVLLTAQTISLTRF